MGISKVNFGRNTLIDLTNDSVTASTLAKGATAHNAAGERVVGILFTTTVDDSLSATSENPVQNKVITSALEDKAGTAEATGSSKGLMSSLDKTKLDSIDYGATKIVVDSKLSSGSKNPVENYIIKAALDNLENSKLSKSGGTLTGNVSGKYFCGTWLQSTEASNLGHAPNRIAVLDDSGWIYYRTVAEILNDIGGASKSYVDSAITQAINSAY